MKAVYELSPETEQRLELDMFLRLDADGLPIHRGNDYERHLYARKLRLDGKTREEARQALMELDLGDVPAKSVSRYIDDVLDSILVGFYNTQPIYEEVDL